LNSTGHMHIKSSLVLAQSPPLLQGLDEQGSSVRGLISYLGRYPVLG